MVLGKLRFLFSKVLFLEGWFELILVAILKYKWHHSVPSESILWLLFFSTRIWQPYMHHLSDSTLIMVMQCLANLMAIHFGQKNGKSPVPSMCCHTGSVKYTLQLKLYEAKKYNPGAKKCWVGVQQSQSYLVVRRYLYSLGWPPSSWWCYNKNMG